MSNLDHAPACARSPINVVAVVILDKPYTLTRCAVCGAQELSKATTDT